MISSSFTVCENYLFCRYPTFFVVGICMILIVSLFLGYHSFYKPVRSEPITPHKPKEENNGNSGHYEMRNGVVLATSG